MIIKVDKPELVHLEKICAVFGLSCKVFTIETNDKLVQVEVLNDGKELEPSTAWYLATSTQVKAAMS